MPQQTRNNAALAQAISEDEAIAEIRRRLLQLPSTGLPIPPSPLQRGVVFDPNLNTALGKIESIAPGVGSLFRELSTVPSGTMLKENPMMVEHSQYYPVAGAFDHDTKQMYINPAEINGLSPELVGLLSHELQHAADTNNPFARGARGEARADDTNILMTALQKFMKGRR